MKREHFWVDCDKSNKNMLQPKWRKHSDSIRAQTVINQYVNFLFNNNLDFFFTHVSEALISEISFRYWFSLVRNKCAPHVAASKVEVEQKEISIDF